MKRFLILFFLIAGPMVAMANGYAKPGDSVYFSVQSRCNIMMDFSAGKINVLLNGKKHTAIKKANKFSKGYYDCVANNKTLFTFAFEDGGLYITNQKYEFACEDAKVIVLSRLKSDDAIMADFKQYNDDNSSLWNDIAAVNDKAFYLGGQKYYKASEYILQQVVAKQPDRTVAWINLGDAQWELNRKKEAAESYKKYVSLMKEQKKDEKKIPQRVFDRIKP